MVLINDGTKIFEFVVYDLDTQKSAVNRLAAVMKTIPKYLYFQDGVPDILQFREKDKSIVVEDILQIIKKVDDTNFVEFLDTLKGKLGKHLKLLDDILIPYIIFNKSFAMVGAGNEGSLLLSISKQIEESKLIAEEEGGTSHTDLVKIWQNRADFKKNINDLIKSTAVKTAKQEEMFNSFEVTQVCKYTSFELEHIEFDFDINLDESITIMEFFNHIKLSDKVPFACINNFFKILKNFTPPDSWNISNETDIIFKVVQKKDLNGVQDKDYTDAFLSVTGETGKEVANVSMSLLTSGNFLSREDLITRFLSCINGLGNPLPVNIKENRVNGSFYLPKRTMDKYVLAELIMNNPLFSSMMSVDDSEKASNKKESLYIHFHNPSIGNITANLTEKISERNDPMLRGKDVNGDFKFGSSYLRVKIVSAENLKAVADFQEFFAKLMNIYYESYDEIVAFYKNFIPSFASIKKKKTVVISEKKSIKNIAPEMFVKGYPQKCQHQPTIIDDNDILALEKAKKSGKIMIYPKEEVHGYFPRNYICEYKNAEYPGLRENSLENSNIFPYLPCCYKKNPEEKIGGIFRHYYYGEDLEEKGISEQQEFIVTNKFAPKNNFGYLPANIQQLFEIFDYSEDHLYVRKGVHDGKSSFLECVMEAVYEDTDRFKIRTELLADSVNAHLAMIRNKLANPANAASCRQEMYDFSTEDIIKAIRDPKYYMDPNMFTSLLEQHFNCNIFVFNRNGIMNNANLLIPRHLQAYYKNKRKTKCIFIYEHTGSAADKGKYVDGPHCELILKWAKKDKHDVSFYTTYNSKIAKGIRMIYNTMRKSYALNVEIPETEFKLSSSVDFFEQGIDSYGKCRMLRFRFEDHIGTMLTEPIQPFVLPEVKEWVATKINKQIAIKLSKELQIEWTEQCVLHKKLKEISGIIGNVKITIPVNDTDPIDGISKSLESVSYPTIKESAFENHNKYRKLARYITEYMFWLFSNYLQEEQIIEYNDNDVINDFVADKIKIDTNFEYGKVGRSFDLQSGVMDQEQLVIKSEETLKRLLYTLRVWLRRSRKKIESYYQRKTIENFYVDVTDFEEYPHQVVLCGDDSVEKWIQEKKITYNINDSVQLELNSPYFFQNQLVEDKKIFLAQNTNTLQKAIEIGKIWTESKFNIGEQVTENTLERLKFKLYRYINSEDIMSYKISGKSNTYDIQILGYKVNDSSLFTVLLNI